MSEQVLEKLAAVQHEIWCHWMDHLFRNGVFDVNTPEYRFILPKKVINRWQRQMGTAYADLSENEKESDREQARKVMEVIKDYRPNDVEDEGNPLEGTNETDLP